MNRDGIGLGDTLVTPKQFSVGLGSAIVSTPVDSYMARGLNEFIGEANPLWKGTVTPLGADTLLVTGISAVDTHAIAPYLLEVGKN